MILTDAMPVEKQRDTTLSLAHQKVIEYCKGTPLARQKDSSYICRLQIESDCKDLQKEKACDLLAKLKEWEQDAREKHLVAKEKNKETLFYCVVLPPKDPAPHETKYRAVPVRSPGSVEQKIPIKAGSFGMDQDLKWSAKYPLGVQEKMSNLISLAEKIRQTSLPVECRQDSDCRVQGMGIKGCGGYVGSIYYSTTVGTPQVISDILEFNKRDQELQKILQFGSTCDYHMLYEPSCNFNVCGPSEKPIASRPDL